MLKPEIGRLAYAAGITNAQDLASAIAIALAESGGDPNAVGDVGRQNNTWGPSVGLWQIRSAKAETGKGTARDVDRLKDPAFNARSMVTISKNGKDWGPWSTWPLQALAYMPVSVTAAAAVIAAKGAGGAVDSVGGAIADAAGAVAPDGLADVGTGIRATHSWISDRNNWVRVFKAGIGGVLVVGGIYAIAGSSDTGRKVLGGIAKTGKTVATKGRA